MILKQFSVDNKFLSVENQGVFLHPPSYNTTKMGLFRGNTLANVQSQSNGTSN